MFSPMKSAVSRLSHPAFKTAVASTSFNTASQTHSHTLNLDKIDKPSSKQISNKTVTTLEVSNLPDSRYYIENGLRKVYPYSFQHSVFCKGRWINRTILDVYLQEFLYPKEHIEKRILTGELQVNGDSVPLDYKLKNEDLLMSKTHRHELPILATPIKVLYEDDRFFVVDKPPSIPVHPVGLYRYNTIITILAEEHNAKDLDLTHRLDRLTSGVLVLTKDKDMSRKVHNEMILRNVQKEYICRVEGEFPDGVVICDQPIKQFYKKLGVSIVHRTGKPSMTEFNKLSFNGKSSVVLCRPKTGRTHQIRVHLQYLGHPIVNDPLYNCYTFGTHKGKHGIIDKSYKELMEDLVIKHSTSWWIVNKDNPDPKPIVSFTNNVEDRLKLDLHNRMQISNSDLYSSMSYGAIPKILQDTIYKKNSSRITQVENCYFCERDLREPKLCNLVMFLHAFKYSGKTWEFETEMPKWAQSGWNVL